MVILWYIQSPGGNSPHWPFIGMASTWWSDSSFPQPTGFHCNKVSLGECEEHEFASLTHRTTRDQSESLWLVTSACLPTYLTSMGWFLEPLAKGIPISKWKNQFVSFSNHLVTIHSRAFELPVQSRQRGGKTQIIKLKQKMTRTCHMIPLCPNVKIFLHIYIYEIQSVNKYLKIS